MDKKEDEGEKEQKLNEEKVEEINDNKLENEEKEKPLDKKQILQDKLKKIFFEREQNKYKYNKINIPENLKYSSENSNSSHDTKNNKPETKDIIIKDDNNTPKDNNNINNENNDKNENMNNNEEKKNNIKQPSKNYVIIKPPERKKNRASEEELKNKTLGFNLMNHKKSATSKKEEENNNKNIIKEEKEQKLEKQENKINNDNININSKEKEEEKNKQLYQQLMAKKCQNIIKLENEKKDDDLIMNNIKVIKQENKDNNKALKDIMIPEIKEEIKDKKRSKTINTNKIKDVSNTKEGTLKILQLIKAKKNEKNLIDEKMRETKNNIKDEKNQNKNEENNIVDNNQKINLTSDKKESTIDYDSIKLNEIKSENKTDNNINININKEESEVKDNNISHNNNDEITKNNTIDTMTKKQIYQKFKGKGKSCLIGNNNNFVTIKNKIEKELPDKNNEISYQQKKAEPKTVLRNKINRHITSLNVTKKNYIIKPKELDLYHGENNIDNVNNNRILIEENFNINNNNEKIRTFQNRKHKMNKLYEPKKVLLLNNNKKQYDERSLNLNIHNKSPIRLKADKKITYIKKSPIINNANKSLPHLNNSLENISPFTNNNFVMEKIIRNEMNEQIDYNKYNKNMNNLNSSFKLANELGKTYYNIGNIFNLDNFEDDNNINLSNNFNINFNLDSLYKINYPIKNNKINQNSGYNTFYSNNYFKENNNIFDKEGNNYYNINNNFNNFNKNNINPRKNNSIYYQYKNNSINNNDKKIKENNINKSLKEKYNYNLYNSLKYEDLLILENKLDNVLTSLIEEKLIYNKCFEFWNYFFNNSLYENLNIIYSNYDNEYKNMFKMSINNILLSIMLLYDISFDKKTLIKINPLLREMLELSHILLISIYEYILNIIPFTKNNIWINKISNLIQKIRALDESDSFLIETERRPEKEKLNLNINFLSKKIHYILNNYSSQNSEKILSNFFKSKFNNNNKSLEELNKFFLENIMREKDMKYSILAFTFIKNGGHLPILKAPFLKFKKSKKYFLVCDIDETLFHFKISEEDPEQGILQIRPGALQLIEEVRKYYEIILFSEAEKDYIDLIISSINNNRFFYDYILCRDYISIEGNNFIKDISKIGTPLDKTIIIDNMPQNFRKHKENAIYIKSFFGEEKDDKALIDLIHILVNIAKSGRDVRKELIKYKEEIMNKISSNLYKNNNS